MSNVLWRNAWSFLRRSSISTRVAEIYPLTEARQAYERLAKGGVRGRLVLVP